MVAEPFVRVRAGQALPVGEAMGGEDITVARLRDADQTVEGASGIGALVEDAPERDEHGRLARASDEVPEFRGVVERAQQGVVLRSEVVERQLRYCQLGDPWPERLGSARLAG